MPVPNDSARPDAPDGTAVVARLRAAGCVFAEEEAGLLLSAADGPAELAAMVERRAGGDPLEHVLGWAAFRGLRIAVEPGVFVPRRRTEFLAGEAAALARRLAGRRIVVDLCCGSGALGAAVAAEAPGCAVHAANLDPVAVRCARRNLGQHGNRVRCGDLFDALPAHLAGRIGVLVANVPYVPTDAVPLLPPEARDHEPLVALDGGPDGLSVLRRVAAGAARWLAPGGHLLVEVDEEQARPAAGAFRDGGLRPRLVSHEDYPATVVVGERPAAR